MTFGQLIEYNTKIFFLKNHTQNVEGKKSKLNISLDQQSEML